LAFDGLREYIYYADLKLYRQSFTLHLQRAK
jgi:hypothetical protein